MQRISPSAFLPLLLRFGLRVSALTGALAAMTISPTANAQSDAGVVYAVTYLDVGANAVSKGVDLLRKYRDASRREADNLEFIALEEDGRPNRFAIFEGWKDQAAFDAHTKAAATSQFLDALKPIRNSPPDRHMLQAFDTAAAHKEPPSGSLVMVEHVDFMPAYGEPAVPLMKALTQASEKEPGTIRYDVYRQPAPRINHYTVFAIWPDAKAFDAHEGAEPTREFRNTTVKPGARANLYDQRRYHPL